jgi:predicted metallopeptidase
MKYINKKTLIIGGVILTLVLLFFLFKSLNKETPFSRIQLNPSNIIFNSTSNSYMDTIVSVGLNELKIKDVVVVIRPITPDILDMLKSKEPSLDIKAFIIGREDNYVIYVVNLSRTTAIEVLSHELIHLQQTETGKLVKGTKSVKWEGIEYSPELPYEERPWEREAFDKQNGLLNDIKTTLYQEIQ